MPHGRSWGGEHMPKTDAEALRDHIFSLFLTHNIHSMTALSILNRVRDRIIMEHSELDARCMQHARKAKEAKEMEGEIS